MKSIISKGNLEEVLATVDLYPTLSESDESRFEVYDEENLLPTLSTDLGLETGRVRVHEFEGQIVAGFIPRFKHFESHIYGRFTDESILTLAQAKSAILQMDSQLQWPGFLHPGGEGVYTLVATKDGGNAVAFFIGSPREDGTIQIQIGSSEKYSNCVSDKYYFLIEDDFIRAMI